MALDKYAFCPGGTGKKLRFCCTDLLPELDKLMRLLAGEQRLAALEHIERLEAKHVDRPCLLTLKCQVLDELQESEKLERTAADFLETHPTNSHALVESAIQFARHGEAKQAIAQLQSALDTTPEQISPNVVQALGAVAQALLHEGLTISAMAHLQFETTIVGDEESMAMRGLTNLLNSTQVPPLLKEELRLHPAPTGAPWKNELDAMLQKTVEGKWRTAAAELASFVQREPRAAEAWRNLATLRAWLADEPGAIEALRAFAALDVPPDDAIEAEALAQLLWRAGGGDRVDVMAVEYPVVDAAEFAARLTADPAVVELPQIPWEGEGPPPRGIYAILDRPAQATADGLKVEDMAVAIGDLLFFGKQTDREARARLLGIRNGELEAASTALARLAGDALGAPLSENVMDTLDVLTTQLSRKWHLPVDISLERRDELLTQARARLLEQLPDAPMKLLDGKTPRQASADPAYRLRLQGLLLTLELSGLHPQAEVWLERVRRELNLPEPPPIEAPSDVASMPPLRLRRLDPQKLDDARLFTAFQTLSVMGMTRECLRFALEFLKRPAATDPSQRLQVLDRAIRFTRDGDQALTLIDEARKITEQLGVSTAPFDLSEMNWQLVRGNLDAVSRLIEHLSRDHFREPGVANAALSLLQSFGFDFQDQPPARAAQPQPGLVLPGGESSGKLWTPDSTQPAGEKKSLWTPGS